jgi:inosose dehydratase
VHLKDFTASPFGFHPLGRGSVDFPGVLGALQAARYDRWVTVELDAYRGAPAEAAAESYGYLQSLMPTEVAR